MVNQDIDDLEYEPTSSGESASRRFVLLMNTTRYSRTARHGTARVNATDVLQNGSDTEPQPQRGPLEEMDRHQNEDSLELRWLSSPLSNHG